MIKKYRSKEIIEAIKFNGNAKTSKYKEVREDK